MESQLSKDILQKLNAIISWPAIAAVGNSTPARLTALAPLIGYLVIYNQIIADFFFLSIADPEPRARDTTALDLFRELKLTFLYFGLVFFGIGAIIFALYAPKNIKKYKSPEEYVLAMESVKTEWLIINNLVRVGEALSKNDYYRNSSSCGENSFSFTENTIHQLESILEHAGRNEYTGDADYRDFHNPVGNIRTDHVLECIIAKRRAERAIWHNLTGTIVADRAREVFYMTFAFDEYSKFYARIACTIMFGLGAIFLLVPTVITSIEVASQAAIKAFGD